MKRILLALGIVFLAAGCGVEKGGPIPPVPDATVVLQQAWNRYDALDFDAAYTLFDSVIRLDNTMAEAHLGFGWAAVQTDQLTEAQSGFSFAIILSGGAMITPIFNETVAPTDTQRYRVVFLTLPGDTTPSDTFVVVKTAHAPVLGLSSASINYTEQPLRAFDDTSFTLKAALSELDTFSHRLVLSDTLFLNYYVYYSGVDFGDEEWVNLFAHVGNAVSTLDVEGKNLMNTVVYARAALAHGVVDSFAHYPYVGEREVRLLLAQAYLRLNLMENCVQELKNVDPTWDFNGDPFDPDNYPLILEELEKLLNEG